MGLCLSGCGGGGGESAPPPAPPIPPASVLAQADNLSAAWNTSTSLRVLDNDTVTGAQPVLRIETAPANGSAEVVGNELKYTPKAGFFGEDNLSYRLTAGNASGTAAVKVLVEANFELKGLAGDRPMSQASIQAIVGGVVQSALTDANGAFVLTIKSTKPTDFLTLKAVGAGADSVIVMTSLVGELGGLAAASASGRLDAAQHPALHLTTVSTAQSGLLAQGGARPSTDSALRVSGSKLSLHALVNAATLVKTAVVERTPLPEGISDTQALVESASALNLYRQQANLLRLESLRELIRQDEMIGRAPKTPVAGAPEVVHEFVFGEEAGLTAARRLTLRADGTGTEIYARVKTFKWRIDRHELVLTYDEPDTQDFGPGALLRLGVNHIEIKVKTSAVFPRARITLVGPDNKSLRLASWTNEAVLIDMEGSGFGVPREVSGGDFMRQLPDATLALLPADFNVGARFAGPLNAPIAPSGTGMAQDVLKLTSATDAVFERTGEMVKWQLNQGRLRIQFPGFTMQYANLGTGPLARRAGWVSNSMRRGELRRCLRSAWCSPIRLARQAWSGSASGSRTSGPTLGSNCCSRCERTRARTHPRNCERAKSFRHFAAFGGGPRMGESKLPPLALHIACSSNLDSRWLTPHARCAIRVVGVPLHEMRPLCGCSRAASLRSSRASTQILGA